MAAWHVDRTIQVGTVGAILINTAVGVWWLSALNSRVGQTEVTNQQEDVRIAAVEQATQAQAVTAAATTAQLTAIKDTLEQMRADERETNAMIRQVLEGKP